MSVTPERRAKLADDWPSIVLIGSAYGGSADHWFHLADTHGQPGILAVMVTGCVDIGVYMCTRERTRDAREGRRRRGWMSWPTVCMLAAIGLTLAGQVTDIRYTPWDIIAALIPGMFLLMGISFRERRAAETDRRAKAVRVAAERLAARQAGKAQRQQRRTPPGNPPSTPPDTHQVPPHDAPGIPGEVTFEMAEVHFATELAAGVAPGVNRIRKAFSVGQPRAQAIRDHLREVAASPAHQGTGAR